MNKILESKAKIRFQDCDPFNHLNYSLQSIQVELRMYNEAKTELKSVMWSKFVHIDMKTQRSTRHALKYMKLFESVHLPLSETIFEDRIKDILIVKSKAESN